MNKNSESTQSHLRALKRKAASFEAVENSFVPNYSEALFSNPLMTVYQAASADGSDGNFYCIQRIEKVPNPSVVLWIRRWNHILDITKVDNAGVLTYLAFHVAKNTSPGNSTIYLVSEYAISNLREAKLRQQLSLADVIKAMYQISETLLQLKQSGFFHHNINPDTIFIVENEDGTHSYKLGNLGGWMKTHEIEYQKRTEYSHTVPLDYDPLNKNSKSDVYSLGITIMEIIGVSLECLMDHKTNQVDPSYQHYTLTLQGFLRKLLLEAVHPDPEKRISLETLVEQLKVAIDNPNELSELGYDTFCASLESVPLTPYQNYATKLTQSERLPMISRSRTNQLQQVPEGNEEEEKKDHLIEMQYTNVEKQTIPDSVDRAEDHKNLIKQSDTKNTGDRVSINVKPPGNELADSPKIPGIKAREAFRSSIDCSGLKRLWPVFNKILTIALILFMYAMAVCIMAVHFGPGVVSSGDVEGGALGIYRNLGALPISDITLSGTCSAGYEAVDLGTWPGTTSFCYDNGYIETNYNASECSNIYSEIASNQYSVWKNTKVCAKRITQIYNTSTCPMGYIKCSPGVCVYGTECGITELYLESSMRTGSGWYNLHYNGNYINYRKDEDALPIISFAIVHGQPTPCLNPHEYGEQINYEAIASKANGCGRYGSFPDISQLDTDTSQNIFSYQTWSKLPTSLPEFSSKIGAQTGYLLSIKRLDLTNLSPCLTFNLQTFLDSSKDLHSSRKVTTGFIITIIVLLGIAAFLTCVMICPSKNDDRAFSLHHHINMQLFFAVLIGVLTIPAAAATSNLDSELQEFQEDLSEVSNYKCLKANGAQLVLTDFIDTSLVATKVRGLWAIYAIVMWCTLVILSIRPIIRKWKAYRRRIAPV